VRRRELQIAYDEGRGDRGPNGAPVSDRKAFRERILGGVGWATLSKVVQILLGFSIMALATRLLAPAEVGIFHLAINTVVVLSIVANLGVEQTILQRLPGLVSPADEARRNGYLRRATVIVVVAASAASLGYIIVGHGSVFSGLVDHPAVAVLSVPIALWVFAGALQRFVGEGFRSLHLIRDSVLFGGVVQFGGILSYLVVTSVLLGLFLWNGSASVTTVLWICSAGIAIVSLSGLGRLIGGRGLRRAPTGVALAPILVTSAPFLMNNLAQYLSKRSDIWMAGILTGDDATGLYATVAVLPALINMPLTNANVVLAPAIGELFAQGKVEQLKRLVGLGPGLALIPAVLLALAFAAFGRQILGLAFGEYYAAGAMVLVILTVGQIVSVAVGSSGYVLMMAGRHVDLMWCSVFGAAVTIVACLVGGRTAGLEGLAVGAAIGASVQQLSKLFVARIRLGFWTHARPVQAVQRLPEFAWRRHGRRDNGKHRGDQ
jgi:O-antigen/teichoic acid export membrane protein